MTTNRIRIEYLLLLTGGVMGLFVALLAKLGNPPNMGVCVVCFIRDIAGGIGLHKVKAVSYIRPEIISFLLGATLAALAAREFRATGGSVPLVRFVIGVFVGISALVFLGCPIRMFGRIAGGDWTALFGLLGVIGSVFAYNFLVRRGLFLGRAQNIKPVFGWIMPGLTVVLLIILVIDPSGINATHKGHAPLLISLLAGLILGLLGQRSGFCSVAGTTDLIMIKNVSRIQGIIALLAVAFVANILLGQFKPGAHPIAHTDHLWSFLSMFVVGLGSMMLGGCPFKQTIMTGQGSIDAGATLIGIFAGTAAGHNLGILASPVGIPAGGKISVLIGIVVLVLIGFSKARREK